MTPGTRFIEANGCALRYQMEGPAIHAGEAGTTAPTMVLIHEAGGSLESWDGVAPHFAATGRTLRYDQRGFGMSEAADTLSLDGMVADLLALLDALEPRVDALEPRAPVRLLGTAIGGSIALAFAARHPERVAAVIATSPVSGGLAEAARISLEKRARLLEEEGMRAITDASLARSYPEGLRRDAEVFREFRLRFLGNDPRCFAALSRAFCTIDLAPLYAQIQCPTLIIGCTADPIKSAAECRALAARLARGAYVEIASGHYIGVISPGLLIDAAETFFKAHRSPD